MQRILVWGITRVEGPGGVIHSDFGGTKPRQILEVLAVNHDQPVSKDVLADALWEGTPPSSYAATLESHVSVVRRHLERAGVPRRAVRTVHKGYLLTDEVSVDLTLTRKTLTAALRMSPAEAFELLDELATRRVQDLLPCSPYATFATRAREELRTLLAGALRRAAEGALELGSTDRALRLARTAQSEDPLSDATERVVMHTLLAMDARSEVLREYADFRDRLREELGVEPSGATQALYMQALMRGAGDEPEQLRVERRLLLRLLGQLPADDPVGINQTRPVPA